MPIPKPSISKAKLTLLLYYPVEVAFVISGCLHPHELILITCSLLFHLRLLAFLHKPSPFPTNIAISPLSIYYSLRRILRQEEGMGILLRAEPEGPKFMEGYP